MPSQLANQAAKAAVVNALRKGKFEHEARETLTEKNLLAVGDIDASDVANLVLRTRSQDYGSRVPKRSSSGVTR